VSLLEYHSRPLVAFDASNAEHRRAYYEFLENKGWGTCSVRFICPEDHGHDLPTMVQRALVQYYIDQEFKVKKRLKPPTARQKAKPKAKPKP